MSRPPKPDKLKKLQGTDRLDRMNLDQPEYREIKDVTPPDDLTDDEKKIWLEIVPQFIASGIYTEIDVQPICMMCSELAEYWKLHEAMTGLEPSNDAEFKKMYKIGQLKQMKFKSATQLMKEYGMTPVARQGLTLTGAGAKNPLKDALPPKPSLK